MLNETEKEVLKIMGRKPRHKWSVKDIQIESGVHEGVYSLKTDDIVVALWGLTTKSDVMFDVNTRRFLVRERS